MGKQVVVYSKPNCGYCTRLKMWLDAKELNELHLYTWENGIKTLYYQHTTSAAQALFRSSVCLACEA